MIRRLHFVQAKKKLLQADVDDLFSYWVAEEKNLWACRLQAKTVRNEYYELWEEFNFPSAQEAMNACQVHHEYRIRRCLEC